MLAQKTEKSLRANLRKLRARSEGEEEKLRWWGGGVNDKHHCLLFSNMRNLHCRA